MARHTQCPPGLGLLPLLGVLLCCVVRCVTDAGDVESARCRVRCLAHLKYHVQMLGSSEDTHITFERCLQDEACTACLTPCGQPLIRLTNCIRLCQTHADDCEQSCRFLEFLRNVRPGVCPPRGAADDHAASDCAAREGCDMDGDCGDVRKCCDNDCGRVCLVPQLLYYGVPEIPRITSVRERESAGLVDLSWQAMTTNLSMPVLYIVQSRHNVGPQPGDLHVTSWQQLTQTTDTSTVVRDMGPGRWYSFRVSAVSINGTQGYSAPSTPHQLKRESRPPGPPQNLTEGQTRFQDGRMTVMVRWAPPKTSDLPVARYKVYWSRQIRNPSPDNILPRENKRLVPGTELRYELDDLEPNTEYLVEVQAVSVYGDVRLRSDRRGLYLRTSSLQSSTQNDSPPDVVEIESLVTLPPLKNISVHSTYFYNGLLKANVTWEYPAGYNSQDHKVIIHWTAQVCIADQSDATLAQPMSATTHAVFFVLYGLRFGCRYRVKLQLTDPQGEVGEVTQLNFASPPCNAVHVIGPLTPVCPTHSPVPPEEPPSLRYSFIIMQTNITAKLMWEPPASVVEITSYRLVWGLTIQDQDKLKPILNQETALTKVLPKDVQIFYTGNLRSSSGYMVHLQALSPAGSGKTAEIYFQTPELEQPVPPYETGGFGARRSWHGRGHLSGATEGPLPSSALPYGAHQQHNAASAPLGGDGFLSLRSWRSLCVAMLILHGMCVCIQVKLAV